MIGRIRRFLARRPVDVVRLYLDYACRQYMEAEGLAAALERKSGTDLTAAMSRFLHLELARRALDPKMSRLSLNDIAESTRALRPSGRYEEALLDWVIWDRMTKTTGLSADDPIPPGPAREAFNNGEAVDAVLSAAMKMAAHMASDVLPKLQAKTP